MKIYSWNMYYRNQELNRAFDFIAKSDFDIFCLQEVPEEFLVRLQKLPYFIAYRIDVERLLKNGPLLNYLVILSKHPITATREIPFNNYWHHLPLRTRLFVDLMPYRFFSRINNRGGLSVDITPAGETSLRVYNLHLILAQPAWRLKEFELAMAGHDHRQPTIVCGDFNILEKPHVTPLNWILGGRMSDALRYGRERRNIEQHFHEHKVINVLRGTQTHPVSRSQLDHILVSHSFSIKKSEVLSDRVGSDHHPIWVEIS
jgi:endonuclease/exonuclease/phosphatase family metal-dependent hydrolase